MNFFTKNIKYHQLYLICLYVVMIILLPIDSYSQSNWVKEAMNRSDSMSVNPEASAWVLVNDHQVEISKKSKVTKNIKKAVKLLKSSGLEYMSLRENISSWRKIKNVKGWQIKSNGEVYKLKKNNIAKLALNNSAGYYDDMIDYFAFFENVRVGDVVAFEYTIEEKSNWDSFYQSFHIQVQEPVMMAQFSLKIPKGWSLKIGGHNAEVCKFLEDENEFTWNVKNLKYQPFEEMMPPWSYISRQINVTCYDPEKSDDFNISSWRDASNLVIKYISGNSDSTIAIKNFVDENINIFSNNSEKLKAIANFMQNEIRYVAIEIGKGRFIPRKSEEIFANRYGDCKDKVKLMQAMLNHAHIQSFPVLASVNRYVDPNLPSPLQFDHCILGINVDSVSDLPSYPNARVNNWLLFDPTDELTQLGELSLQLHGSKVLLAVNTEEPLIRIPRILPDQNYRKYEISAFLDNNGNMTSNVKLIDYGTKGIMTGKNLSTSNTETIKEKFIEAFSEYLPSLQLSKLKYKIEEDSTLVEFNLEQKNYIVKTGDLNFLQLDFIKFGRLPKLIKGNRIHPIWFGSTKKTDISIQWELDNLWEADTYKDSTRTEYEQITYSSKIGYHNNIINTASNYVNLSFIIEPENYEFAREIRNKISKNRSNMIKLTRKTKVGN